jgi:hypothetical protein
MPQYRITTVQPDPDDIAAGCNMVSDRVTRTTVDSLDEARTTAGRRVEAGIETVREVGDWEVYTDAAAALPESGGTIGPLADGTVIEVRLRADAPITAEPECARQTPAEWRPGGRSAGRPTGPPRIRRRHASRRTAPVVFFLDERHLRGQVEASSASHDPQPAPDARSRHEADPLPLWRLGGRQLGGVPALWPAVPRRPAARCGL